MPPSWPRPCRRPPSPGRALLVDEDPHLPPVHFPPLLPLVLNSLPTRAPPSPLVCRARRRSSGPPRADRSGREGSPPPPLPPHRQNRAGEARFRRIRPRLPDHDRRRPGSIPADSGRPSPRRSRSRAWGEHRVHFSSLPRPFPPSAAVRRRAHRRFPAGTAPRPGPRSDRPEGRLARADARPGLGLGRPKGRPLRALARPRTQPGPATRPTPSGHPPALGPAWLQLHFSFLENKTKLNN